MFVLWPVYLMEWLKSYRRHIPCGRGVFEILIPHMSVLGIGTLLCKQAATYSAPPKASVLNGSSLNITGGTGVLLAKVRGETQSI